MTDKNTLDLARQWAADIDADRETLSQDTIDAAADLISSLPDEWIDADKVRELLDKWATNPFPTSDEVAVLNDVESLLPVPPAPRTLADMSPEERAECQWMQADLEGVNGVIRVIVGKSYTATSDVLLPSGAYATVYNEKITPLHDLPPMKWPGSEPEDGAAVADSENVAPEQGSNLKEKLDSSPRPEHGEAWEVEEERLGKGIGIYFQGFAYPWFINFASGEYDRFKPGSVTPIARLVPEATEQDDVPEFDPAYTYRDKAGNKWVYMGDAWRWVDSLSKEHGLTGYHTPPADYGPYTRIEDTNNE